MKRPLHPINICSVIGTFIILTISSTFNATGQTLLNFTLNPPVRPVADFGVDYTTNRLQFVFWDSSSTTITSWYWDFGDGTDTLGQNVAHTYSQKGIYTVCLAVENDRGCVDTSCQEINSFLGLNNSNSGEFAFKMYPNPSDGKFFIRFHLNQKSDVQLSVYNMLGEKVYDFQNGKLTSGNHEFELDGDEIGLESGVYFVRLSVDGKEQISKMILNGH